MTTNEISVEDFMLSHSRHCLRKEAIMRFDVKRFLGIVSKNVEFGL